MKKSIFHLDNNTLYPGSFHQYRDERMVDKHLKRQKLIKNQLPMTNLVELNDEYKIELMVPGISREEIMLEIKDHLLTIRILKKNKHQHPKQSYQMHEFDSECKDRIISLPKNASGEFVCAELHEGILHVHLKKANQASSHLHTHVAVY